MRPLIGILLSSALCFAQSQSSQTGPILGIFHTPLSDTYDLQKDREVIIRAPAASRILIFYRVDGGSFSVTTVNNEYQGPSPSEKVFEYFGEYEGHLYYALPEEQITWPQAKQLFEDNGGHLITINSEGENQHFESIAWSVYNLTGEEVFWLGLTDEEEEGSWHWITGEPITFSNWVGAGPDNAGDQDYARTVGFEKWKWDDDGLSSTGIFIMEVENGVIGKIPPFPPGSTVEYYIEASDSSGVSVTDPPDAPLHLHSYKITEPPPGTVSRGFINSLPDSVLFSDSLNVSVRLLAYRDHATVPRFFYHTAGTKGFKSIALQVQEAESDTFIGKLTSFPHGTVVEYYYHARDGLGSIYTPSDAPQDVLSFVVYGPSIEVTPQNINFGFVNIAQTAVDSVKIKNAGNTPLHISSISSNSPRIRPLATSLVLEAGESNLLPIAFTPLTPDPVEAQLTIQSNDPVNGMLVLPLTGMLPRPSADPLPNSGKMQIIPDLPSDLDSVLVEISGEFSSTAVIASSVHSVDGKVVAINLVAEEVGAREDSVASPWRYVENVGLLAAGDYEVIVNVNGKGVVSSALTVKHLQQTGPISLDAHLALGDQQQRSVGYAAPGKVYTLQLNVKDAPEINGWSATIEYDSTQVRYVNDSFHASDFIPGLVVLVDSREGTISVGGTVLGSEAVNSGDGTLGTLSFEILETFKDQTDLVISAVSFRRLDGIEDKRTVYAVATIAREAVTGGLAGDFDASGKVEYSDFFLFADAFGGRELFYDLSGDGSVGFDDFFLFADNFGK